MKGFLLERYRRRALGVIATLGCLPLAWHFAPKDRLVDSQKLVRPTDAVIVIDRHAVPLRHTRSRGSYRRWVPISEMSPWLIKAVISVEDQRFRTHSGVDPRAIARASVMNLLPGSRLSGASTITQQLIKLTHGRPRGLASKGVEALRALALEEQLSKDQILEQYLNRLPYGDSIVGVERASEEYFGKSANDLDLAEAALIAGIPQAPSITEPRRHLRRALARRNVVLERMRALSVIDATAHAAASRDIPSIRPGIAHPWKAPRFVDAAWRQWRQGRLDQKNGTLATSLDHELSRRAEYELARVVRKLSPRGVENGALVVVANATGEVLAYVGAALRGPSAVAGKMDLLRARRQPGSTLKPFVYERLFARGATAATLLRDVSTPMTGARGEWFQTRDYDGRERGPVRARVALATSLNHAALDAARQVGARAIVDQLTRLGFEDLAEARSYGAAIVLGGADVTPLELARAYMALARGGSALPLTYGLERRSRGKTVMAAEAAAITIDILSDPRVRRDAFGTDLIDLAQTRKFGLKTGTSSSFRDAWAASFDELHTVVVWLGDPERKPLARVSGFEAAAPVAARVLGLARRRAKANSVIPVQRPQVTLSSVEVCAFSGRRPGPRCTHRVREHFGHGAGLSRPCDAHDRAGRRLVDRELRGWLQRERPANVAFSPDQNEAPQRPLVVAHPRDGARLLVDSNRPTTLTLRARAGNATLAGVAFQVDGKPIHEGRWTLTPGNHEVVATWRGNKSAPARVRVIAATPTRLPRH